MTDPIADMLARIKNAASVGHKVATMPASKQKRALAKILAREGWIERFDEKSLSKNKTELTIVLKYNQHGSSVIREVIRVSKPSRRVYVKKNDITKVKGGYGMAIISTSKGLMTGEDAIRESLGGEIVCKVF